jgi:cytochrome c-type biogenesis protein CcmF
MLIHKSRKTSLGLALALILSTFILVLYSTFLTRSGVLGDSSVHAFTDLGMSGQLLLFLFAFTLIAVFLFAVRVKEFPKENSSDKIYSREFWMFLGALSLALSAFHIGFTTSFPVINKIFGTSFAKLEVKEYNKWQTAFAILITFLVAVGQYFRYVDTDIKVFRRKITLSFIVSLVISLTAAFFFGWLRLSAEIFYSILLFTCVFAVMANLDYFIRVLKGKLDHAGPSIAHLGFGMLLLGAVISTGTSKIISVNYKGSVEMLGSDYSNAENIMMSKNDTLKMGDYLVCYRGKSIDGINIRYEIEYMKRDSLTGEVSKEFTLYPFIQLNERMGNAAEPDTRHFIHKDIYTHIKYAEIETMKDTTKTGNYGEPHNNSVLPGDTIFSYNGILVYDGLVKEVDTAKYHLGKAELYVSARIRVFDFYKNDTIVFPVYYIVDGLPKVIEAELPEMGMKIALWKIDPETGKVDISFVEKKTDKNDWIVMKAIIFPGINLLWVGCLIMIIGTAMAIRKRIRKTNG